MSTPAASLFVGDVVIQNPKQAAVIFSVVVILSVMLEFVFAFFRTHKRKYIHGLFQQVSEEIMIIGTVGLLFVFIVQSFNNLPASWVLLFQYVQTVIFFMMLFFIIGVIWTAFVTKLLCSKTERYEHRWIELLLAEHDTHIMSVVTQSVHEGGQGATNESFAKSMAGGLRRGTRADSAANDVHSIALRVAREDTIPKGQIQQTAKTLRDVFHIQVRASSVLPLALQRLLCMAELIRRQTCVREQIDVAKRRERGSRMDVSFAARWNGETSLADSAEDLPEARKKMLALLHAHHEDISLPSFGLAARRSTLRADDSGDVRGRASSVIANASLVKAADLMEILELSEAEAVRNWIVNSTLDKDIIALYIPFSKYLYRRMRTTVIKFVDITWQSWLSLIFSAGLNSLRLYMLPGDLQSKPASELTYSDRVNDHVTFIVLIGYLPALVFLVGFVILVRNFLRYLRVMQQTINSQQNSNNNVLSGSFSGRPMSDRHGAAEVWIPPHQLAGEHEGESFADPCRFLLRSNRGFTLHVLKIPALLIHFYFSIFVVGMWGDLSLTTGTAQVGLIPFALLPVVVVFGLLPFGLFAVTALTSLGLRIERRLVHQVAVRRARQISGKKSRIERRGDRDLGESHANDDDDDDDDSRDEDDIDFALLAAPLSDNNAGDTNVLATALERTVLGLHQDDDVNSNDDSHHLHRSRAESKLSHTLDNNNTTLRDDHQTACLRARIMFLEEICHLHGVDADGQMLPAAAPNTTDTNGATAANNAGEDTTRSLGAAWVASDDDSLGSETNPGPICTPELLKMYQQMHAKMVKKNQQLVQELRLIKQVQPGGLFHARRQQPLPQNTTEMTHVDHHQHVDDDDPTSQRPQKNDTKRARHPGLNDVDEQTAAHLEATMPLSEAIVASRKYGISGLILSSGSDQASRKTTHRNMMSHVLRGVNAPFLQKGK